MQTTTYSLADLLKKVKSKALTVPQFQRRFVWQESQVKLLVDSISRSYPVGSLLLLASNPEFPLQSRTIEAVLRDGYPSGSEFFVDKSEAIESFLILDGQQRTTSIARVFMNAHPAKCYYIDLKKVIENFRDNDASWIITRARGKSDPDRKDNGRLLRADLALDREKTEVFVSEYYEDKNEVIGITNKNEARKAAAFCKSIFETIRNYQIPAVILNKETDVDSICRVFETINSTGTRLTTFDLAVARFFPAPDLRAMWDAARLQHKIFDEYDVDGERVLQTLALMRSYYDKKSLEPTRTSILSLSPEFIGENWDKAVESIFCAYRWGREQFVRPDTIPNHGLFVSIGAYIAVTGSSDDVFAQEQDFLRKWFFCRILQAGMTQASNTIILRDFQYLVEKRDALKPAIFDDVYLDPKTIMRLRRGDNRYKAIQIIMSHSIRQDMITGESFSVDDEIHDHHIFPRAAGKKHDLSQDLLDAVSNRVPLKKRTNLKLGEAYPTEYLNEAYSKAKAAGTETFFHDRMRHCLMPISFANYKWQDDLEIDNFIGFCERRSELIFDKIRSIIGSSLKAYTPSVDEEANDDLVYISDSKSSSGDQPDVNG